MYPGRRPKELPRLSKAGFLSLYPLDLSTNKFRNYSQVWVMATLQMFRGILFSFFANKMIKLALRRGGGIGRRARFRTVCRKEWRVESSSRHNILSFYSINS